MRRAGELVWYGLGVLAVGGAMVGAGAPDAPAPATTVTPAASTAEVAAAGEFSGVHEAMLASINAGDIEDGISVCFEVGTPNHVVVAFQSALERLDPSRFQQSTRWSSVASGVPGSEGDPITLRYSFAPDGTFIPSGVGEGAGVSDLFAYFDSIYATTQEWQDLFHSVFDRWSALTGVSYIYEPNDDGAGFFGSAGQIGVRGDVRIGGKFIDGDPPPGTGNILAYNGSPNGGDMVLDTGDDLYQSTTGNSLSTRNVISHEHGHGLGQSHVCPVLGEKLMEPFLNTSFDGPRHDDIRNAHDYYGDFYEPNGSPGAATNLGLLNGTIVPSLISGGSVPNSTLLSINEKNTSPYTNDIDYFRFDTDSESQITVIVNPVGLTYQDNPQACGGEIGSCCSGTTVDSLRLADLKVELTDVSGTIVYASSDSAGLGESETIQYASSGANIFLVRVSTTTNNFYEPQMYSLTIDNAPPPAPGPFSIVYPMNGSTEVPLEATLDWSDSSDASSYTVVVDDSPALTTPAISQVVGVSEYTVPPGALAADTQYFWRVTAMNVNGTTTSTPSLSGFRTEDAPPPACACIGNLDADCDTDVFDFNIFAFAFGTSGHDPFTNGDFDGDGDVDVFDFNIFAPDFGCVDP